MSILLRQFPYSITLSGLIGSSDTSITVSAGDANDWPDGTFFKFAGSDEICQKTAGGGTTSWTIRRGEHATTAETHADGTTIYRLAFNVSHAEITLGKDGTALDPPTLSLTSLLNGFELSITAPSDTGNRLAGYEIYKGTATAPTTLFDFVSDPRSSGRTIHLELDSGETVTDTFYFRAKSRTKSGVLSTTFSNEVSGTAAELDSAFLQKNAQSFITDIVFSATDNDTVQWTSGTLKTADGTSYSINSGNTGNMTELVVIYFDPDVSTTDLQIVNVSGLSVAINRIWVCMAQNQASTAQDAFFVPFVGVFGINETQIGDNSISTAKIQALAITAGKIAANTITAAQITTAALTGLLIQTTAGGVIRTDSSGERVQISSTSGFEVYGSAGTLLVQIPVNTANIGDLVFTISDTNPGQIVFGSKSIIRHEVTSDEGSGQVLYIEPQTANDADLQVGGSSKRWSALYGNAETWQWKARGSSATSPLVFVQGDISATTRTLRLTSLDGALNPRIDVYLESKSTGTVQQMRVEIDLDEVFIVRHTGVGIGDLVNNTQYGSLHIRQDDTAFGEAMVTMEQADVDAEFFFFEGTAASADLTRNIVDNGDVTTATLAGWYKVYAKDDGNQITDGYYFTPLYTLA